MSFDVKPHPHAKDLKETRKIEKKIEDETEDW